MIDVRELGELQLDGLREVANIGSGHAATALSQLTGNRILVDVPQIQVVRIEDVARLTGREDEVVAAVLMLVLGDITGRTIHVFPSATASRLAGSLLRRGGLRFPDDFGELEQSALKEAGNILAGAYLNALADFLGMLLLTSVPGLAVDMAGAVLTSGYIAGDVDQPDYVFSIDTVFRMEENDEVLRGHLFLLPDAASLRAILRALRLA